MGKSIIVSPQAGLNSTPDVFHSDTATIYENYQNFQDGQIFLADDVGCFPVFRVKTNGKLVEQHPHRYAYPAFNVGFLPQDTIEHDIYNVTLPAYFISQIWQNFIPILSAEYGFLSAGATRTFRCYINDVLITQMTTTNASSMTNRWSISMAAAAYIYFNALTGANNATSYLGTNAPAYYTIDTTQPMTVRLTWQSNNASDLVNIRRVGVITSTQ